MNTVLHDATRAALLLLRVPWDGTIVTAETTGTSLNLTEATAITPDGKIHTIDLADYLAPLVPGTVPPGTCLVVDMSDPDTDVLKTPRLRLVPQPR